MTKIYCDGACKGNPGPIGIGVVIYSKETHKYSGLYKTKSTNNIAELVALKIALFKAHDFENVTIFTDSLYSINCITKWAKTWELNNWSKKGGIKNKELIKEIYYLYNRHPVPLVHVKGHSGIEGNEEADSLANLAINKQFEFLEKI